MENKLVKISYTNYKDETKDRIIIPTSMYFGFNEWHPEPQWILMARDVEKNAIREFAMKDIHKWIPLP